jgi:hypothetical protein
MEFWRSHLHQPAAAAALAERSHNILQRAMASTYVHLTWRLQLHLPAAAAALPLTYCKVQRCVTVV